MRSQIIFKIPPLGEQKPVDEVVICFHFSNFEPLETASFFYLHRII